MDDSKDQSKPVIMSEEAGPASKPRRSGKGGAEMPKEDEIKPAGEKPDQPKAGEPAKDQPKEKATSKVRSGVERLRRNIDR